MRFLLLFVTLLCVVAEAWSVRDEGRKMYATRQAPGRHSSGNVDGHSDGPSRPTPKEKSQCMLQHVNDTYHRMLSLPETGPDRDQKMIGLARWFVSKAKTIDSRNGCDFREPTQTGDDTAHDNTNLNALDGMKKAMERLGSCLPTVGIAFDKNNLDIENIITTVMASDGKKRKQLVTKLYNCLFPENVSSHGGEMTYEQMLSTLISLVEKVMAENGNTGSAMFRSMLAMVKSSLNVGEEQDTTHGRKGGGQGNTRKATRATKKKTARSGVNSLMSNVFNQIGSLFG